jgi:hypothetical protein
VRGLIEDRLHIAEAANELHAQIERQDLKELLATMRAELPELDSVMTDHMLAA